MNNLQTKDEIIGYLTFVKDYAGMYLKQARINLKGKK
jgi:hypothetical protein